MFIMEIDVKRKPEYLGHLVAQVVMSLSFTLIPTKIRPSFQAHTEVLAPFKFSVTTPVLHISPFSLACSKPYHNLSLFGYSLNEKDLSPESIQKWLTLQQGNKAVTCGAAVT